MGYGSYTKARVRSVWLEVVDIWVGWDEDLEDLHRFGFPRLKVEAETIKIVVDLHRKLGYTVMRTVGSG